MAIAAGLVVAWACALRAGGVSTRAFNPDEFEHLHGGDDPGLGDPVVVAVDFVRLGPPRPIP